MTWESQGKLANNALYELCRINDPSDLKYFLLRKKIELVKLN
jgi:hypothetical protein